MINPPSDLEPALRALDAPPGTRRPFDAVLLFVRTPDQLDRGFPLQRDRLAERGALWVAWPKGGRTTGLTLPDVIRIGYGQNMVESKTIGLDTHWSAIKFTRPVPGKVYRNSYGALPSGSR